MKASKKMTAPAMRKGRWIQLLLIGGILISLAACKKDKDRPQEPEEKKVQVKFKAGSVAYNLIDSAFVILKKEGSSTQTFKRFEKSTDLLSFSIDDLSAGNWTAEMYIFARFNATGGRRYRQEKTFTIPSGGAKNAIPLDAPTGAISDSWKPYAFFRNEGLGVSVAVALDNTDPHFDIQVRDTPWELFYIERYANNRLASGANAKVAEYIWSCDNGCYTSDKFINNDTGFLPFTREVGNKEWNNGLIIVVLNDLDGADVQFSHSYNK